MPIFVYCILGFLLFATIVPFFRGQHWFWKGFEFFRIQFAILGAIAILCIIVFALPIFIYDKILLFLATLALLFQLYKLVPYLAFGRRPISNEDTLLRLIVANVLMENNNKGTLIDIIQKEQPDCFLTVETDIIWEQALNTAFEKQYPYQVSVPQDNYYGMHLYSRFPLSDVQVLRLVDTDYPSILAKVCVTPFTVINLLGIHPPPPTPLEERTSKKRDVELLIAADMLKDLNEPVIVCGDLNDVPWSRTTELFKKISGLLDPRLGHGFHCTFHADIWLLRAPIDHLFHSTELAVTTMRRLPKFGSDHFAMYYEVTETAKPVKSNKSALNEDNQAEAAHLLKQQEEETTSNA
ncbi:MAG: endonuclease/exonuclease/phosphatase family protein [Bacteroidota bacterium]